MLSPTSILGGEGGSKVIVLPVVSRLLGSNLYPDNLGVSSDGAGVT